MMLIIYYKCTKAKKSNQKFVKVQHLKEHNGELNSDDETDSDLNSDEENNAIFPIKEHYRGRNLQDFI